MECVINYFIWKTIPSKNLVKKVLVDKISFDIYYDNVIFFLSQNKILYYSANVHFSGFRFIFFID